MPALGFPAEKQKVPRRKDSHDLPEALFLAGQIAIGARSLAGPDRYRGQPCFRIFFIARNVSALT